MNSGQRLLESLQPAQRLAIAYGTSGARAALTGVFALETRLAKVAGSAREPMLAQIKLAWWRDALQADGTAGDDPLLEHLRHWSGGRALLIGLVDAWENFALGEGLGQPVILALADARAAAMAVIACTDDARANAVRHARQWALWDIACHLSDAAERDRVLRLAGDHADAEAFTRLPRNLRPIAMLSGLARRRLCALQPVAPLAVGDFMAMVRIGLLGR